MSKMMCIVYGAITNLHMLHGFVSFHISAHVHRIQNDNHKILKTFGEFKLCGLLKSIFHLVYSIVRFITKSKFLIFKPFSHKHYILLLWVIVIRFRQRQPLIIYCRNKKQQKVKYALTLVFGAALYLETKMN